MARFLLYLCVSNIVSFRLAAHTFWCFQDNWIAHQDDFNQLLAALNTCHSQETAGKDTDTGAAPSVGITFPVDFLIRELGDGSVTRTQFCLYPNGTIPE